MAWLTNVATKILPVWLLGLQIFSAGYLVHCWIQYGKTSLGIGLAICALVGIEICKALYSLKRHIETYDGPNY